ncbi:MAG: hypothetical protein ACT4QD_11955, partial [Acidobacteriota bacterium]
MTASLEAWVAQHGPLAPPAALVMTLEACARASRMRRAEFAAVIGSLNAAGIVRDARGGWTWHLVVDPASARTAASDGAVLGRVGAILFYAFTGEPLRDPFAPEQAIRGRLRKLRPELAPQIGDLTLAAIMAGHGSPLTLDAFARDTRRALGVERLSRAAMSGLLIALVCAVVVTSVVALLWWISIRNMERVEAHGFTPLDTVLLDISEESAHTFALVEEHTAAIQVYQEQARLMTRRISLDDPRLPWNAAHEAWVRTLRADRFTTEQILENAVGWLGGALGGGHPYARTARLLMAATLDARGATAEASQFRVQAEEATRDLLEGTGVGAELLQDLPIPPGVVAHVATNDPVREGFRQQLDGRFFVPLSSVQRWLAARNGWRLHVVASAACRVSVVVGNDPSVVTV